MSGPSDKERTARALASAIHSVRRTKEEAGNVAGALSSCRTDHLPIMEYQRLRLLADTVFFLMDEIRMELVARLDVLDGYESKVVRAKVPTLFRAARKTR